MSPIPLNCFPASFPIIAPTGSLLGYVDNLSKGAGKTAVTGWTIADEVGLCCGTRRVSTVPTLDRSDVAEAHPGLVTERGSRVGFHIEADAGRDAYLFLRVGPETHYVHIGL